jgi:hypothetical protein
MLEPPQHAAQGPVSSAGCQQQPNQKPCPQESEATPPACLLACLPVCLPPTSTSFLTDTVCGSPSHLSAVSPAGSCPSQAASAAATASPPTTVCCLLGLRLAASCRSCLLPDPLPCLGVLEAKSSGPGLEALPLNVCQAGRGVLSTAAAAAVDASPGRSSVAGTLLL